MTSTLKSAPWPGPRTRVALAVTAVVCAAIVLVIGHFVAGTHGPLPVEHHFARRFIGGAHELRPLRATDPHHWLLALAVVFGEPVVFGAAVIVLCALALSRKDHRLAELAAVGPITAEILTEAVAKPYFARYHGAALGYPSGHTTAATAIAFVAVMLLRRTDGAAAARRALPFAAAIALVTAAGVVLLRWHYPTDALAGWAMGVGVPAAWAAALLTPRVPEATKRSPHPEKSGTRPNRNTAFP